MSYASSPSCFFTYFTTRMVRGNTTISYAVFCLKKKTNVGHKPTVGGEKFIGVETYLFDCNEDLYGEYCKVDFKKFLRPEQKFSSLEALKAQLERDAVKGQEYFETL